MTDQVLQPPETDAALPGEPQIIEAAATEVTEEVEPAIAAAARERAQRRGILEGLIQALQGALDQFDKPFKDSYFVVHVPPDGKPTVFEFTKMAEVAECVAKARAEQNKHPEDVSYMYIFRGAYLRFQKGAVWQLFDGEQYLSLETSAEVGLSEDGALLDKRAIAPPPHELQGDTPLATPEAAATAVPEPVVEQVGSAPDLTVHSPPGPPS